MAIARDLLALIERVGEQQALPPIREVYVAPAGDEDANNSNFGFVVLEDETVGLTYVGMDDARAGITAELERCAYRGASPLDMARLYTGQSAWRRAFGLAAVNAVSQVVLRQSGRLLREIGHTIDLLGLVHGDHVGMVGYFPPLVEQIGALDIPLTVVELDEQWLRKEKNLEVTLDPTRLSRCNKVLCTGTTLVNQTLDAVLTHTRSAKEFCLIGPTASCLPDPLFDRGVTMICGCQVIDCNRFIDLWSSGQRWRDATHRYVLTPD